MPAAAAPLRAIALAALLLSAAVLPIRAANAETTGTGKVESEQSRRAAEPRSDSQPGQPDPSPLKPNEEEVEPTLKESARPEYPEAMRDAGITGEVVVGFIVDRSGNAIRLSVVRSTRREFEAPALAAVSKWKFTPGKLRGQAVYTRMEVPIVFALDPGTPPSGKK